MPFLVGADAQPAHEYVPPRRSRVRCALASGSLPRPTPPSMPTALADDCRPAAYAAQADPTTVPVPASPAVSDELTDDDLEHVVGGLARTWTDALRAARSAA